MGETLENYLFLLFFGVIVILQAEICGVMDKFWAIFE